MNLQEVRMEFCVYAIWVEDSGREVASNRYYEPVFIRNEPGGPVYPAPSDGADLKLGRFNIFYTYHDGHRTEQEKMKRAAIALKSFIEGKGYEEWDVGARPPLAKKSPNTATFTRKVV